MSTTFNVAAFEAWLLSTGRYWNHLNTEQRHAVMAEYRARAK